jgi:hypothetical protein
VKSCPPEVQETSHRQATQVEVPACRVRNRAIETGYTVTFSAFFEVEEVEVEEESRAEPSWRIPVEERRRLIGRWRDCRIVEPGRAGRKAVRGNSENWEGWKTEELSGDGSGIVGGWAKVADSGG